MSPKRKKRAARKPVKAAKKSTRTARKSKQARKPARRPKQATRARAKAKAKPKPSAPKRAVRSTAGANGAARHHRSRHAEEPVLEQATVVEEESITIGGYDESEDFEESYTEDYEEFNDSDDDY